MAKNKRKIKLGSDRYQDAFDSKDKGGAGGGKNWLTFKDKVKFYEPKEGVNRINIIPYEIKTKNHPRVKAGKAKIGDYDYNLDVYVHKNVGPGGVTFVCPKKNYGKACPVCEEAFKFYEADKKDEGKALLPQRRVVYNVEPIVKGESQGLQIWDVSHFLFEKELIEEAHACVDGADIVEFADPEEGKVIKFRGSETTFGKNKYLEFKNFNFEDREEELDDILDDAVSLDEALTVLSAEEIEKIFYGAPDDEAEEDEAPAKGKKSDDDDDDRPRNKRKEESEPEEDERPRNKNKKDDPFNDDDVPIDKPVEKDKKNKCPHGYRYGKDTDEYKECKKCPLWDDCMG